MMIPMSPKGKRPPAPTQLDGSPDEPPDESMGTGKRDPPNRTSPEKKKRLKTQAQPLPEGCTPVCNSGEGNCLFLSVGQAIEKAGGGTYHHRAVRSTCVNHLQKHKEKYFLWWDGKGPDESPMPDSTLQGFEHYLKLVAQTGAYAGNLEVAALAATMDRPIYVIHERGQIYAFNPEGSRKNIFLRYISSKEHWEALEVTSETALAIRTKALPGRTVGGRRGGGKSNGSSLGGYTKSSGSKDRPKSSSSLGKHTVKTAAATGSLGGKTAKDHEAKEWLKAPSLGGHTQKGNWSLKTEKKHEFHETIDSRKVVPESGRQVDSDKVTILDDDVLHFDQPDMPETAPKRLSLRSPKEVWTCPDPNCGVVLTVDPGKCGLYRRRRNHMDRYHADQTNKQIFHMREYLKPVEAVFGLPKEQQDWLCCWCFSRFASYQ